MGEWLHWSQLLHRRMAAAKVLPSRESKVVMSPSPGWQVGQQVAHFRDAPSFPASSWRRRHPSRTLTAESEMS